MVPTKGDRNGEETMLTNSWAKVYDGEEQGIYVCKYGTEKDRRGKESGGAFWFGWVEYEIGAVKKGNTTIYC